MVFSVVFFVVAYQRCHHACGLDVIDSVLIVLHITNKRTKVTKTKDENFDKIEKGIREINHRITE